MTTEQFLTAINDIDDKFIKETTEDPDTFDTFDKAREDLFSSEKPQVVRPARGHIPIWKFAVSAAACLAVILGVAVFVRNFGGIATSLPIDHGVGSSGSVSVSAGDSPRTEDENMAQTFTEDFDGIVLTVTTDKSVYEVGEPINLTATLENNSGKDINLYYGTSTTEEGAVLTPHFKELIEYPIRGGIGCADVVTVIPFKQGEKCVQEFTFQTYTGYDLTERLPDYDKRAEPGVYYGMLCVLTHSDTEEYPYEIITDYSLEFSVTISDRANGTSEDPQTGGEVIVDQRYLDNMDQSRLAVWVWTRFDVDSARDAFKESIGDPDIYHDAWINFLSEHCVQYVKEIADDHGFSYEELSYPGIFTGNFRGEFDKEIISSLLNDERVVFISFSDDDNLILTDF